MTDTSEYRKKLVDLWQIVKSDSLASSKIGHPSGDTRDKLTAFLEQVALENRVAELENFPIGEKFPEQIEYIAIRLGELQAQLQGKK